ncbi:unnamed protein product [Bemisia tabaci]|uniref:Uncharacterized protein n=1 Tax=Bemisia tabaci TaxID=7038 RepID=A0A9P0AA77_BEMTA|nr:unnamed protein product [Bemisia tabaci]
MRYLLALMTESFFPAAFLVAVELVMMLLYMAFVHYDPRADAFDERNNMNPVWGGFKRTQMPTENYTIGRDGGNEYRITPSPAITICNKQCIFNTHCFSSWRRLVVVFVQIAFSITPTLKTDTSATHNKQTRHGLPVLAGSRVWRGMTLRRYSLLLRMSSKQNCKTQSTVVFATTTALAADHR